MSQFTLKRTKVLSFTCSILCCGFLSACGGGVSSNPQSISLSYGDSGSFKGIAGTGWTDSELKKNAFGVLCPPPAKIGELKINRSDDGTANLSGHCIGKKLPQSGSGNTAYKRL